MKSAGKAALAAAAVVVVVVVVVEEEEEEEEEDQMIRDVFIFLLLMHPTLSGQAFQFFKCRTIEDTSYLMTDYQLQCFTPEWTGFAVFVIFFIVLFSIGLPVSVVAFLVYKRKCLQQRAFQNQFGIFYGMYRSDAYWFEGVSMMSKLALWMTLVIFEYGSEMQLVTALVINVVNLCVQIKFNPFKKALANYIQTTALIITFGINLGGLALKYLTTVRTLIIEGVKVSPTTRQQSKIDYLTFQIDTIKSMLDAFTLVLFILMILSMSKSVWQYFKKGAKMVQERFRSTKSKVHKTNPIMTTEVELNDSFMKKKKKSLTIASTTAEMELKRTPSRENSQITIVHNPMHSSRSSKPTVKRKESTRDGRITSDVVNPIYSIIRSTSSKPTVNAKNQAKPNWTKQLNN